MGRKTRASMHRITSRLQTIDSSRSHLAILLRRDVYVVEGPRARIRSIITTYKCCKTAFAGRARRPSASRALPSVRARRTNAAKAVLRAMSRVNAPRMRSRITFTTCMDCRDCSRAPCTTYMHRQDAPGMPCTPCMGYQSQRVPSNLSIPDRRQTVLNVNLNLRQRIASLPELLHRNVS